MDDYPKVIVSASKRSETTLEGPNGSASVAAARETVGVDRRVLVVDCHNERFADLKFLFEERGYEVAQAATGRVVAHLVKRFAPDLILVNGEMPDESGWLITCKLRLTAHRQPIWIYAARTQHPLADWKEVCGCDDILAYGGVLGRLMSQVRQRLERWHDSSESAFGLSEGCRISAATWDKCA